MQQPRGVRAARADEVEYDAFVAARRDPRMSELPVVEFVRLDNGGPVADSVVEARLGAIKLGEPLDVDAVERAMNTVYGLDYYQNVRYGLVNEADGTGIELELDERSWGPNYLQLGMEYSSAADSDSLFGLAASYLSTAINPLGGEWRATVVIGDEPALDRGPVSAVRAEGPLLLRAVAESRVEPVQRVRRRRARHGSAAARGDARVRRRARVLDLGRVPVRRARRQGRVRSARRRPDHISEEEFRRGEFFGRFSVDTMDSIAFPREGSQLSLEWRASRQRLLDADADFDQLLLAASYAKTWGRHTVLTTLRYDATISGTAADSRLFRMGGFFDISGLNRNQLSGQHATRLGAAYYRRIGNLALFPAFAGVSLELGNAWAVARRHLVARQHPRRLVLGRRRHAGRADLRRLWTRGGR